MNSGKSLGIGAVASLGIFAFGISALWPLGIVAAAITHAVVNGNKRADREDDEDTDSAQESEDSTDYRDNGRPRYWEPPARSLERISWGEQLVRNSRFEQSAPRLEELFPPRRNTDFMRGMGRITNSVEEVSQSREEDDEQEEVIHNPQLHEPSLRNEAYFRRHGRG